MSQRAPLKIISIVVATLLSGAPAMAVDGMITIPSNFGARQTADRLEADIKARGMTVFARIDHAAGGRRSGIAAAAHRAADLRQRQGRHAADAGHSHGRHRLAAEGAGVRGFRRARSGCPTTIRSGLRNATGLAPPSPGASMRWLTRSTPLRQRRLNCPEPSWLPGFDPLGAFEACSGSARAKHQGDHEG